MIQLLVDKTSADVDAEFGIVGTVLNIALMAGNLAIAGILLKNGAYSNFAQDSYDAMMETAVFRPIAEQVISLFLKRDAEEISIDDSYIDDVKMMLRRWYDFCRKETTDYGYMMVDFST